MSDLLNLIKQAAVDAVNAESPTELLFGFVETLDPLEIRLNQDILLDGKFIILGSTILGLINYDQLNVGDRILLIKEQGGQKYLAADIIPDEAWLPEYLKGEDGADGTGVSTINAQYYLSTSKTEQVDGEWGTDVPAWEYGYYLWTRIEIAYSDETVSYTSPSVSSEWEATEIVQSGLNSLTAEVELNTSNIEQGLDAIQTTLSTYYITNDQLESFESTMISQTSENIEFVKTTLGNDLISLSDTVNENQQLIEEYIRFDGAEISLGTSDSDFTAVLDNEKLAFQENGQNVAYISNQKMNISDAEVENSLKIGNFKWQPRDNGNLSLVYIG